MARTGAPWRDPPDECGKWYTVYTRFWQWAKKGVWERIFKHLCEDSDFEYVLISVVVRSHATLIAVSYRPLEGAG